MGAGHGHTLHFHGHSLIHRLPGWAKILALVTFMLVVVATPRETWWAFLAYAGLLAVAIGVSKVPVRFLAPRLLIEVPFVIFALTMPFVARGPRVDVFGLALSHEGLWGAWGLLAKGTLGVVAALLLGATTEVRDLLIGLTRLRVPAQLVEILAFMLRYLTVLIDDLQRMRIAQASRGFRARNLRQWPVLGRTVGVLFVRSFERGERVHRAMLARGYAGRLPLFAGAPAATADWRWAFALPGAACLILLATFMPTVMTMGVPR